MRNSSDIFCLKEAKAGENDGSMIFSVNGARSVRINRRSSNPMDGFQYGSNSSSEGGTFRSRSEILKTDSEELNADSSKIPVECDEDSPRSEEEDLPIEPKTSRSSDEVNTFVKLDRNEADANVSSIKRNILTGEGMEVKDSNPMKKKVNNTWTR
ncbi:uncharacterized protein LOC123307698 [Coccinella septempunctata]|uniref:uncharacterized protein LOC123307698 n=1 Tax=Coccinella septempunctata TaxID=41139 RepID=UPI001D084826|nr:uncharacterized protein LOC123307698 [Coccinella septempunctata]